MTFFLLFSTFLFTLTLSLILVSRADYHVVRYFPAFYSEVTKVSSARPEALSFAYRSRKKCMSTAIIFVTDCFFYRWSEHFMTYCRVSERGWGGEGGGSPREKL